MKLIVKIFFLLGMVLTGLSSCKDFLETPQQSGRSFITTVDECQGILDKSTIYTSSPKDGQISCDDYFFNTADFNAQNEFVKKFYNWAPDAQRFIINGGEDWSLAYAQVNFANTALESLEKIAEKDPSLRNGADFKMVRGMGLFVRAYIFYQIAVQYARPYTAATADQDMGIPTRLTSDINAVSSRGTVKQTYEQIIKDLKEALDLLPVTVGTAPTRPSKAAAYALLARVYLAMGDYVAAGAAANSSLLLKSTLMVYDDLGTDNAAIPFTRFNPEVLYHSTVATPALATRVKVNADVYASYTDPNDLRKVFFYRENGAPNTGTYSFKGSYSQSTSTYFNGLAVDEVYLIRAECYARAGNTGAAMTDLNTLLRSRWTKNTYVNLVINDKDAALTKILQERRKELMMRGQRWSDLKRLNTSPATAQTISRSGNSLPPNDLRYQLLLPESVITYGKLPQNPR